MNRMTTKPIGATEKVNHNIGRFWDEFIRDKWNSRGEKTGYTIYQSLRTTQDFHKFKEKSQQTQGRSVGGEEKEIVEEHLEHRIYLGMGFQILGFRCLSNLCTSLGFTLQRITSDASTILLTYFALDLSSTILNLPLPLCRILASIFTSSINKKHQQEYFLAVVP